MTQFYRTLRSLRSVLANKMLLLTVFQLSMVFELFFFLLLFFPSVVVYEQLTSRLSGANVLGTSFGKCDAPDGCGVCKDMTSAGGTIESPNYPDNYSPDLNCMFTINSPSQTIIQLTFTDFSVEQCCDFVSIFDGTSDPLQVGLSGSDIPDLTNSTTSTMTIKFTTNSDNASLVRRRSRQEDPAQATTAPPAAATTAPSAAATTAPPPPVRWQAKYKFLPK